MLNISCIYQNNSLYLYHYSKNYNMNEQAKYLTVKDYAAFMSVSEKTVYNWMDSGRIPKEYIKTVLSITLIKKIAV